MEELNNTLSELNLPQVDAMQYEIVKNNSEKQMKRDVNMRTAKIRISAVNKTNIDNDELGVKAGDIVTYTDEDIKKILDDWAESKHFDYYMIKHDEDLNNIHWHIVIVFAKNSVCKFSTIKKKFPYGDIETCKFGVKCNVQYLVHLNHPMKHQYDWESVITNNPAKLELYKVPTQHTMDAKLEYIIYKILCGEIKEYEITQKIDADIYIKYNNRIKRAFEYVNEESFVETDRDFQVYVLQGPPRVGKSTFCKCWAKKKGKSIAFSSAGKHAIDEYRGQTVFVFDDYNYSITPIEDMKKLLDPHNNTGAAARYHNKSFKNVDTIFICSNTPITDWYIMEAKEDRDAFFKRISYVLNFEELSDDYVATYTVNKIVYSGKDGNIEYLHNTYHDYKKMVLKSVDGIKHTFDLKKYVNPDFDEDKKKQFLSEIETL